MCLVWYSMAGFAINTFWPLDVSMPLQECAPPLWEWWVEETCKITSRLSHLLCETGGRGRPQTGLLRSCKFSWVARSCTRSCKTLQSFGGHSSHPSRGTTIQSTAKLTVLPRLCPVTAQPRSKPDAKSWHHAVNSVYL